MEKRKSMSMGVGGEQKSLTSELTQGKELAQQLMTHLHHSSSQETTDFLISQILFSYEKSLSLVIGDHTSGDSNHRNPNTMLESPSSFGNSSPLSEISDQDSKHKNVFKKRKAMPRWTEEVKVSSETSGVDGSLDDGFSWRKYGQKDILGANHPRGYFRCTHRGSRGCLATKQVQKSDADPTIMVITYRGEHTCNQVSQLKGNQIQTQTQTQTLDQPENPKQSSQEGSFSFGGGLRVKTEDLGNIEDDIFPSFSFPYNTIESENVGDHTFCETMIENDFTGIYSPKFASPAATFESDYFPAMSPCHVSSFQQTSESGLTEIISAPTSVTNSPIGDFDFSIDDLDFQAFENPECFAYQS